jgi:hypothetical protein
VKQLDTAAGDQDPQRVVKDLSRLFSGFAGSSSNAGALVNGLRDGTAITLSATDAKGVVSQTTFTPTTGQMGFGDVFISLALAQHGLLRLGIPRPSAQELQAVLMGGAITTGAAATLQTTQLDGVLQLRSSGADWRKIAGSLDVRLAEVINSIRYTREYLGRPDRALARSGKDEPKDQTGKDPSNKSPVEPRDSSKKGVRDKGKLAAEKSGHADRPKRSARADATDPTEKTAGATRSDRKEKLERAAHQDR